MKLVKLQIENFRNYHDHSYSFEADPNITILVGNNGLGKTNLLEAIYILSLGRSFRTSSKDDLVQWGKEYFRCKGEVVEARPSDSAANLHPRPAISAPNETTETTELEVFYSSFPARRRNFRINGVNTPHARFLGNLITVLFHPEDLNMLYLSPTLRRDYLDTVLSQTDREYVIALSNYQKVLKQRNSLLGQIREARFKGFSEDKLLLDLDVWDEELVKFGEVVVVKRKAFVDFISGEIGRHYKEISGENDEIRIEYQCNVLAPSLPLTNPAYIPPLPRPSNPLTPHSTSQPTSSYAATLDPTAPTPHTPSTPPTPHYHTQTPYDRRQLDLSNENQTTPRASTVAAYYAAAVLERRQLDLIQAKTTRGPHRDDLFFHINDKRIDAVASRGEFRTLLLAIKLAEIDYIKAVKGINPLLLLDDVFSELDPARQKHLLKAISGCQTIITTTHWEGFGEELKGVKIVEM